MAAHPRFLRLFNFGVVGGVSFVVDVGLYNLLRVTVLDDKPIGAKVISVAVATIVAWLGNRYLTFRDRRESPVFREGVLFGVINIIGLLIAAGCLFISHYLLGFHSQLADNVAGNGVGLVIGMVFRFLAYRYLVFRGPRDSEAVESAPAAVLADDARREPAAAPVRFTGAARPQVDITP